MLLAGPAQYPVVNPTENETEYGCFMIEHIVLSHYFIVPNGTEHFTALYSLLVLSLFIFDLHMHHFEMHIMTKL